MTYSWQGAAVAALPGADVPYRVHGDGQPLLLLDGAGAGPSTWTLQVPALVKAGYRVILAGYRGMASGSRSSAPFTLDDLVADAAGFIRYLGLGPTHVAGFSLGAMVAQELAAAQPDLVLSATLVATRARTDKFRMAMIDAAQAALTASIPVPYLAVCAAMQMLSPVTLADDSLAADWLNLLDRPQPDRDLVLAQHEVARLTDRRAVLGAVRSPCLVLSFADDVLAPPSLGAETARAIPDARFEVLAECGHLGMLEQPHAVTGAITRFLDAGARATDRNGLPRDAAAGQPGTGTR